MQTFLPYPDFVASARCLDARRLGKQRIEAFQILNILLEKRTTGGWVNHPAVNMWRGYEGALSFYMNVCIREWMERGYKNSMSYIVVPKLEMPVWVGNDDFHASHRSNLLRKDADYYGKFGWKEPPDLPYIWPENKNENHR